MSSCRHCGDDYGPMEPVTVPLRALPTVQLSGIEGQRCTSCGDLKYRVPNMEELFRVVAGLLVHKPERLSGSEARFLRKWLGWSGQDTAERLGFTPETVSRWENDKVLISETADKLLRSLVRVREPIDDYATWDAELSTLAKADPDPLSFTMVKDGSSWAKAA
ncbi:MAG: helix-turn-helix domain-containing protein [Myxococcales bacterium]|nr:helix-turn-helix domain-containing protein [Myxococcales bacterium]